MGHRANVCSDAWALGMSLNRASQKRDTAYPHLLRVEIWATGPRMGDPTPQQMLKANCGLFKRWKQWPGQFDFLVLSRHVQQVRSEMLHRIQLR